MLLFPTQAQSSQCSKRLIIIIIKIISISSIPKLCCKCLPQNSRNMENTSSDTQQRNIPTKEYICNSIGLFCEVILEEKERATFVCFPQKKSHRHIRNRLYILSYERKAMTYGLEETEVCFFYLIQTNSADQPQ